MRSVLSPPFLLRSNSSVGNRSVLIVGAGVAGPVLAYFLHRFGVQPVVVERAPQLRTAGQTIDIRGAGREVVRRMGVESKILEKLTGEDGVAFVDSTGRTRAAFGVDGFGGQGFVSEIEILRGELVNVLYERSRSDTEYIFDDHPSSISDQNNHVQVTFASGNIHKFDLVIGADGLRSKTRRLAFGGKSPIHYLDRYIAYFTIPYSKSDGTWARWYNAPGGQTVILRPDNQGTTRAILSFRSSDRGYEDLGPDMQKELLQKLFADAGFEASRVLNGLKNANDFYFEAIGQVKMDQWSQGRVALVGDAAYCASPSSGMGTSLALIGAYILAGEIGRHRDHTEAFRQYEALMRPYVARAQKIPSLVMYVTSPKTRTGIALRNAVFSFAANPVITRLISKFMATQTSDKISLPEYEDVLVR
jgi:2-polyprenyl-6-methoxyphenol hydroxylase-like FAD-dependent oxidoreductase